LNKSFCHVQWVLSEMQFRSNLNFKGKASKNASTGRQKFIATQRNAVAKNMAFYAIHAVTVAAFA
jgi:hypothetical protein